MALQSHRVLQLPEILDFIFGLLDRQSNVANAQVCEAWFNVALDALWGHVHDWKVPSLFAILAPLEVSDNGYVFARALRPTDWKRFDKYATHVRSFEYDGYPALAESTFGDIARTRRQLNIFPNLRTFMWSAPDAIHFSSLFMHSGIQKLWLVVYYHPGHPVETTFEEIIDRMPNLSELTLDIIPDPIPVHFGKELSNMLRKLTNLREIRIPEFCYTTQIIEALSHLQLLCTITFYTDFMPVDRATPQGFPLGITAGAFPTLHNLNIPSNFLDVVSLLQSPYAPSSLIELHIDSELVETSDSARKLAFSVSTHLQELKKLRLESARVFRIEYFTDIDAKHSIKLATLQPLFHLPYLTSFEFDHQYPLLITQKDIELLASSCPAIEKLDLCGEPSFYMQSTLTLAALIPLALHCTKLNSLTLFIDATNVPELSPEVIPPQPFMSLHFLSFGLSIIDNATPVAIYLSQLIPPECKIYRFTGAWWMSESQSHVVTKRSGLWSEVRSMVTSLSKIIANERRRTRALECELQELRALTGMATEQDAMLGQGMGTVQDQS